MSPAENARIEITVCSSVPGRIRWRIPALIGKAKAVGQVCDALAQFHGVRSVDVNGLTGSVLVFHNLVWDDVRLTALLRAIINDLDAPIGGKRWSRVPDGAIRAIKGNQDLSPLAPPSSDAGLVNLLVRHNQAARKALALTFVDRLFEASPPALISLAVDSVSRKSSSTLAQFGAENVPAQLGLLVAAGAGVWTADSTVGYFRSVAASDLANAVRSELRDALYVHFQTLDLAQIESQSPGYWESVFQDDVGAVARYFQEGIDPLVSIVANSIIVFWQLLRMSFGLAVLQLIVVPGLYLISKALLPAMQARRRLAGRAQSQLSGLLRGNVEGISTIASFAKEQDEAAHVQAAGTEYARLNRDAYKVSAAYVPLLQMVVGVGFLGTLGLGGLLVNRGKIVTSELSMLGYSSLRLLHALGYLGISIDNYQQARTAMGRIQDFLRRSPQVKSGTCRLLPTFVAGDFEVKSITFGYPNEEPLFENLSLSFPKGKMIGIVGQSGAGKTTLLKLLLRYYDLTAGEILLDGHPLRSLELQDLRRAVAYVPQQPFIFPGTIRENIAYSRPDASDEEVRQAAITAVADEFIEQFPDGYDTVVRRSGTGGEGQALSGGQAQRLAIARAALANTPVLLFDEATSALDNSTESAIQQSLQNFSASRTTIIVAHRLAMVRHADHIYVLDRGQVREEGTHDELVARDGVYAGFWRVQTGELTRPAATEETPVEAGVDVIEPPASGPMDAPPPEPSPINETVEASARSEESTTASGLEQTKAVEKLAQTPVAEPEAVMRPEPVAVESVPPIGHAASPQRSVALTKPRPAKQGKTRRAESAKTGKKPKKK